MRFSRFFLACLPLAALLGACARQPITTDGQATGAAAVSSKLPSRFVASPPTIDGQATEWTDSLHYDANSKLQYEVLNDTRTVYLRLKAADIQTQAKLAYLGMVVWLDTTGRNQQQLGFRYPLPVDLSTFKAENDRPAGAMGPSASERQAAHVARLRQIVAGAQEMELLNYKGSKEPTLTDAQSQLGVKAAMSVDAQNNLIYELAVPLRLLYRRLPALASGQAAVVGVTLASMKPKVPAGSKTTSDYDVSGSGGMGGMGGMRGGYGGYGGGYGGRMGGGYGGMSRGGGGSSFPTLSLRTSAQLAGK